MLPTRAGSLALLLCSAAFALQPSVSEARYSHLARGVNLTRWFQYGSRIPITTADRDLLKQAGFTAVRIPVAPQYLLYRWSTPDRVERNLANLDKAIDLFLDAGMAVTLDFHADAEYLDYYLATRGAPDSLIVLWRELASRYAKRDPELLFFEIMNEPDVRFSQSDWDAEQQKALAAIREVAPLHTVILDSVNWSGLEALLQTTPYADSNVIYALHYYSPSTFTHQGADWTGKQGIAELRNIPWPSYLPDLQPAIDNATSEAARNLLRTYRDEDWDSARIDWDMHLAAAWARRWNVRVVVNEFGDFKPFAPPESRARWLRDVRVALDREHLAWAVWDYAAGFDLTILDRDTRAIDPQVSAALALSALPVYSVPDPVRPSPQPMFSGPRIVQMGPPTDPTGFAEGILATDINADGVPDLVIAPMTWPEVPEHPVQVYLNDGAGIFHAAQFEGIAPTVRAVSSIVAGRFDSSGRPGFFFPDPGPKDSLGAQSKLILPAAGDRMLDATANLPQTVAVTWSAAAGDIDGDGFDDLALFNQRSIQLLHNDGQAHFEPVWNSDTAGFTCGVFVPRGRTKISDLLVFGKSDLPARVFRNDGNGHFSPGTLLPPFLIATSPASGGCATVVDLNTDGFPDVIVAFKQGIQILIAKGDGTFRDETAAREAPLPPSMHDIRRIALSGNLLVITRVGEPPLLQNLTRDGRFTNASWQPPPSSPWVAVPADINHDGVPDLIFAQGGATALQARFAQVPR
jgi:hypothetical protein